MKRELWLAKATLIGVHTLVKEERCIKEGGRVMVKEIEVGGHFHLYHLFVPRKSVHIFFQGKHRHHQFMLWNWFS